MTADKIVPGKSTVTLRVDGQEVTQPLPAHANLKFDLDITITDDAIHNGHPDDPLKYQLDREYQLPIDYKSISDTKGNNGQPKDHVVYENGVKVATLRVVPGEGNNAKLQISYDRAYVVNDTKGNNGQPKDHVVYENGVKVATLRVVPGEGNNAKLQISYDRAYVVNNGKNTNFYFRYGLDVNWIPNVDEETLRQGEGNNAKLQISYDRAYVVNNGKNTNFYFRYGLDVNWIPNVDEETLRQTWEFPGTGTSITVQREPWGVTGQKSCTQPDIDHKISTSP